MRLFLIVVMSEGNKVLSSKQRNYSLGVIINWSWEKILKNCLDSLSDSIVEIVEDQMRIGQGDSVFGVLNIMSHYNIGKSQVNSGSYWEMTYDQSIGDSFVLMDKNYIRKIFIFGNLVNVLNLIGSSINLARVGKYGSYFFVEPFESVGRVSRSSD
jgi:hypothetical protein